MFERDGSTGVGWAWLRCARAVAVLLVLCLGLAGRAEALPVYECTSGVTGNAWCDGAVLRDDGSGPFTGTVWACDGQGFDYTGYASDGTCPGEGWVPVALLGPGWFVEVGSPGGGGVWLPWSFFPGLGGAGAPGGGGGAGSDGWTFDDLDPAAAARTFSVGFMIVALFWALGKGAGLVVWFVRRM